MNKKSDKNRYTTESKEDELTQINNVSREELKILEKNDSVFSGTKDKGQINNI